MCIGELTGRSKSKDSRISASCRTSNDDASKWKLKSPINTRSWGWDAQLLMTRPPLWYSDPVLNSANLIHRNILMVTWVDQIVSYPGTEVSSLESFTKTQQLQLAKLAILSLLKKVKQFCYYMWTSSYKPAVPTVAYGCNVWGFYPSEAIVHMHHDFIKCVLKKKTNINECKLNATGKGFVMSRCVWRHFGNVKKFQTLTVW